MRNELDMRVRRRDASYCFEFICLFFLFFSQNFIEKNKQQSIELKADFSKKIVITRNYDWFRGIINSINHSPSQPVRQPVPARVG